MTEDNMKILGYVAKTDNGTIYVRTKNGAVDSISKAIIETNGNVTTIKDTGEKAEIPSSKKTRSEKEREAEKDYEAAMQGMKDTKGYRFSKSEKQRLKNDLWGMLEDIVKYDGEKTEKKQKDSFEKSSAARKEKKDFGQLWDSLNIPDGLYILHFDEYGEGDKVGSVKEDNDGPFRICPDIDNSYHLKEGKPEKTLRDDDKEFDDFGKDSAMSFYDFLKELGQCQWNGNVCHEEKNKKHNFFDDYADSVLTNDKVTYKDEKGNTWTTYFLGL